MTLVSITEEATVTTDGYLACLAVVAQLRIVLGAQFFPLLRLLPLTLLILHQLHHVGEEAARDELV